MFENKPENIRMIGLDLDGTTLDGHGNLTPRVCAAIEKAIAKGIVVLPATGRSLPQIPEEIKKIQGMKYAVTVNGAEVTDIQNNTRIYEDYFETEDALRILKIAEEKGIMRAILLNGEFYFSKLDVEGLEKVYGRKVLEMFGLHTAPTSDLHKIVTESTHGVGKIELMFLDKDLREEMKVYPFGCEVTSSFKMNLELNTKTANKGAALLALAEKLGIKKEEVMAMGDNTNDIEMLKAVGYSVAMGNAVPELKELADDITASHTEDGVALAIEAVIGE